MTAELEFTDPQDLNDLQNFLLRAKRLDELGAVKLKSFSNVLAVYVSPIYSSSLIAVGPTVLGLRTIQLAQHYEFDVTFEISAILDRLAAGEGVFNKTLRLPPTSVRVAWSGITPPRQGWEKCGDIMPKDIVDWAKAGIAEVAQALPDSVGSAVANRVRSQVWGKSVSSDPSFSAGAAFASYGLGFLKESEPIELFRAPGWIRLSSSVGHVLSKEATVLL